MQLEAQRSGFSPDELEFGLSQIQRNTIANNKVVAQLEYSLKNQNTINVKSNTEQITPGSEIVFSFDKAYLANNSYLNRCKMRADLKVRIPIDNSVLASAPGYVASGQPGAGVAYITVPRGWDNRNSALAPFILNKALSRREIDFSGKAIQSQTFNDMQEIDELACMYNQDILEIMGIYPDKVRGFNGNVNGVYGEVPGRPVFYDSAQSSLMQYSESNEYLLKKEFFKRNQNGKYYWMKSNNYYTSAGVVVGGVTFTRSGNQSGLNRVGAVVNPTNVTGRAVGDAYVSDYTPNLDLTATGITAIGAGGYQEVVFSVEEDLISDLFTNIYVDKPRYYAMNSAELNFRFEQSANMNSLFKSASPAISGVPTVTLERMTLEFITFNLGTVQIPFKNFEVPFFLQVSNRQNYTLAGGALEHKEIPVISYSTIPHYIKIDLFQSSETSDWSKLTKNLGISRLTLQIDQDVGNALQQMTIQDLYVRTLKNLGMWHQTWDRVYYNQLNEGGAPFPDPQGTAYQGNYLSIYPVSFPSANLSTGPILPFLFLRVGTDIRLQPGLEAGMRERINMTFGISTENATLTGTTNVTCKITAYTCAKYKISPINGLLDTVEVSYSRVDWMKRIETMNQTLREASESGKLDAYRQEYTTPESMVLGGSWFSTLASSVGPVLSAVKGVARAVKDIAPSGAVQRMAEKTHDVLDNIGMGKPSRRTVKYV